MARTIPFTPRITFLAQFGRRQIAGADQIVTDRRIRAWNAAQKGFIHRQKNGVYDPFTYFHVLLRLSQIEPHRRFTAKQLTDDLNAHDARIAWDSTTVGRVLADMIESFEDAYPPEGRPIVTTATWAGRLYETTAHPMARAALARLLDDLVELGSKLQKAEAVREFPNRAFSPMRQCPSLVTEIAA